MNLKRTLLPAALAGVLAAGTIAKADDTAGGLKALRQQIEALDQKVRILERRRELDQEAADAKSRETPRMAVSSSGLSVSSADTNFVFALHGVLQVDNRTFFRDAGIPGNDGFLLRRARPIFQGTVYRDFDFLFVPDFGGSSVQIYDAWLNYRYQPWLQVRAGKFKVPVGLEQLQSDPVTSFNERSLVTGLTPNRDLGFQLWGEVGGGMLSYAAGVFNGVGDGRNTGNADFEDHREFAGRVFLQPFKKSGPAPLRGLGLGVAGSWGNVSSNSTGLSSGYLTDGQQTFFAYTNGVAASGDHWRLSPQAYYYFGPFGLMGEYVISDQQVQRAAFSSNLRHTAWQVSAGWVLTGEDASYAGVSPKHPFNPVNGDWGALQLVGRYGELDIDNAAFPLFANPAAAATAAQAWAVGLNWYLNKSIRVNTSFARTTFTGGGGAGTTAPATVTRQPEEVLFTRLQLAF
jgi:phosphate-selective porin OprO and OprP